MDTLTVINIITVTRDRISDSKDCYILVVLFILFPSTDFTLCQFLAFDGL